MVTFFVLAAVASAASPQWIAPPLQMKSAIQNKLATQLLDGESARYRWPKANKQGAVYCGFVNAKNSYGAFTGFKPFYVLGLFANGPKGDGRFEPMSIDLLDPDSLKGERLLLGCANEGFDMRNIPEE